MFSRHTAEAHVFRVHWVERSLQRPKPCSALAFFATTSLSLFSMKMCSNRLCGESDALEQQKCAHPYLATSCSRACVRNPGPLLMFAGTTSIPITMPTETHSVVA